MPKDKHGRPVSDILGDAVRKGARPQTDEHLVDQGEDFNSD